jgi:type I restriction enzyme, S subunit
MAEWKRVNISQFLKEREGRYDPNDGTVQGLKRLNKIDFSGEIHLSDKDSKTDMIVVEPGDLVISGINVSKGALAVYHGEKPITATIHYSSYVFDEKQIDIEYFKRFVRSQSFIQALKDQVKGGIKTEIKPKHFLPLEIDLPDIEIQKDIVSFFKRVEGDMDELGSEISSQIKYLNKFRQAMLQEAIEGKLTAEWRKQNPALISGDNHASKLLEKIKAEKERLIKEGKIKKDKPLSPIADEEKPFALPEGWAWCRFGNVGIVNPRNYIDDDLDVAFSPMALISEKYGVCPTYETKKWRDVKKGFTHFAENDIAIAKITPCFENSKACVFEHVINGYGAGTTELHVLRPIVVSAKYIYWFVKTSVFLANGEKQMTGVCGQKRVPVDYFSDSLLPLAPLAEQQAIVERVDKLMFMIDELEKQVTERKNQSEMLMQSVLREAFAG